MIGLIAAMAEEQESITEKMQDIRTQSAGGVDFYAGRLADEDVVVARSGEGKVAAAIASTLLCMMYKPDALISIGVAGGLKDEQNVGDLVLSDEIAQADFDLSFLQGEKGIGKVFEVSEDLLERGRQAARKAGIPWSQGMVATQDLFMADKKDYDRLMSRFPRSACSEMEGGAIAQVAAQFGIPCLVIRTLSDVAVHDDNPVEFSSFALSSSKAAARFLEIFCTRN